VHHHPIKSNGLLEVGLDKVRCGVSDNPLEQYGVFIQPYLLLILHLLQVFSSFHSHLIFPSVSTPALLARFGKARIPNCLQERGC
jgi:hypothetical protein